MQGHRDTVIQGRTARCLQEVAQPERGCRTGSRPLRRRDPPKKERGDSSLPGKPRKRSRIIFLGKPFVGNYFRVENKRTKKGHKLCFAWREGKNEPAAVGTPLSVSPQSQSLCWLCSLPAALIPCSHIPAGWIFPMEADPRARGSSSSGSQRFSLQEQIQQQHKKQEGSVAVQGQGGPEHPTCSLQLLPGGIRCIFPTGHVQPTCPCGRAPQAAVAAVIQLQMAKQVLFLPQKWQFITRKRGCERKRSASKDWD